jgi:signal transduction histidine kinase
MLEAYRKAINPASLLEVVPKDVLQSHLQGFLYGTRTGTLLIYDTGVDLNGNPILERLEPMDSGPRATKDAHDWRQFAQNSSAFCAAYRQDPTQSKRCEDCDLQRAQHEFRSGPIAFIRYECHMGLLNMTLPIKVAGRVRGVVFSGQKIVRENSEQRQRVKDEVRLKAWDAAMELEQLVEATAQSRDEVIAFERGFRKFVAAVQATVDAFFLLRRHESDYETLLEVAHYLGAAIADNDDQQGWLTPAQQLLAELTALLGGLPLWLLQRRGSRYQCVVEPSGCVSEPKSTLRAAALIGVPVERVVQIARGDKLHRELTEKLQMAPSHLSLIRCDAPSGSNDVVSLVLVVGGAPPDDLQRLLVGCVRVLSYPAGISTLIHRLETQKRNHATKASYVGHHLKTPIQSALHSIYEAKRHLPDSDNVRRCIQKAETQVLLGLADAMRLQDAASIPTRGQIDAYALVQTVVEDLQSLARPRGLTIRISPTTNPFGSYVVIGFDSHLRVAFTNLIENALKYAFESSYVDIRFDTRYGDSTSPGSDRLLRVEIVDVGVGFPPEEKDDLFNLGARRDHSKGRYARSGSGIGLVQAREYIETVGGFLDIDSSLVSFSQSKYKVTAVIHLPLAKA